MRAAFAESYVCDVCASLLMRAAEQITAGLASGEPARYGSLRAHTRAFHPIFWVISLDAQIAMVVRPMGRDGAIGEDVGGEEVEMVGGVLAGEEGEKGKAAAEWGEEESGERQVWWRREVGPIS